MSLVFFDRERAIVQGVEVNPSCANVFVVADSGGAWSVTPAAMVEFDVPTDANPGTYVSSMVPAVNEAIAFATR